MLVRALWAGLFCVILGGAASLAIGIDSPVPRARALVNCDTSTAALDAEEQAMLALVNNARANEGLAPLANSANLNRAAAWKSEDSSASGPTFSHTDSLGRDPFERMADCGYLYGSGENILSGQSSAQSAFNAWMNSSGHRANILSSSHEAIGIGRSGTRWTMTLGFVDDSGSPQPTNTPTPTATPTEPPATATASPTEPGSDGLSLPSGLNGIEYNGPAAPPAEVFDSLGNNLRWVYSWNASAARWDRYLPGAPGYVNTLQMVVPGGQYFLWLSAAEVLEN